MVEAGETVLEMSGPTRSILTGERVALNLFSAFRGSDLDGSVR